MKWLSLFAVLTIWTTAHAACEFFEELVTRPTRPTLAEVVQLIRAEPGCEQRLYEEVLKPPLDVRMAPPTIRERIARYGPELIAFFEAMYPNGVYATLGRDSYLIGDLIEAFYIAHNVASPVVRLGASGPTVQTMSENKTLFAFLQSNGLDIGRIASGETPFVIIDRTPYNMTSQSRRLLRSALEVAQDEKLRREIKLSLNVVSTQTGWDQWERAPLGKAPGALRIAQMEEALISVDYPTDPLAIRTPEGGKMLVDRAEVMWHGAYGCELVTLPNGCMVGTPGPAAALHDRWTTLRLFWDLYKFVGTNQYWAQVAGHYEKFTGNLDGRLFWNKSAPELYAKRARARLILGRDYTNEVIRFGQDITSLNHRRLIAEQWLERENQFENLSNYDLGAQIESWRKLRRELKPHTIFGAAIMEYSLNLRPSDIESNSVRLLTFIRAWFVASDIKFEDLRMVKGILQQSIRRQAIKKSAAPQIIASLNSRCRVILDPPPPKPYEPAEGLF